MRVLFLCIASLLALNSCSILKPSPKRTFVDGYYLQTTENKKQKVYVDVEDEIVRIHQIKIIDNQKVIDKINSKNYPVKEKGGFDEQTSFSNRSFDIDILTIPLKYRFPLYDVPSQLNANLNGAVYLGYRTDKYSISYLSSPKKEASRNITHYGFSMGLFTGLGNTAMNPTNTFNRINQEYEGIIWNKGMAGIFAINNFTAGFSLGLDNLLDYNRKVWIYEGKPWIGIAFGLNLN